MKIIRSYFLLVALPFFLSACATHPPIQYQNVIEPRAVQIEEMRSDKPILGLALGSGGQRGYAHIGVIKALEENDVKVDLVVGTSAGSVVGALYAGGYNSAELEQLALKLDQAQLNDYELSRRGYIRGEQLQDFINRALKNRSIEQLDRPFVAVATKLTTGDAALLNRGNTGKAVRASSSIPGVFYPVDIGGEEYVDGDLKKPVPVSVAHDMGADVIIAVDISQQPKDNAKPLNIIAILTQSLRIMRQSIVASDLKAAQVVIRPVIGYVSDVDAASKEHLIQAGYDATILAMPEIRAWLRKVASEKKQAGATRRY